MNNSPNTTSNSLGKLISQKIVDYQILVKFRLSLLVVFSSTIAFLLASDGFHWERLSLLALSGFLVTGAASALNQVLEKDYDKLMARTANRPLAAGRMDVSEAVLAAGLMSVAGILMLASFNPITGILGAISFISYAFIYTPLKRVSPIAVWVGAIPGALPMSIGWVAVTGNFGVEALFLFSIQFFWQFPHFWAIAWVSYDDYAKAGFYLLPTKEKDGRNKGTALQAIVYALCLIPLGLLAPYLGIAGWFAMGCMVVCGLIYTYFGIRLYLRCDKPAARQLMFCSFFYLPIVLLALLFDKI